MNELEQQELILIQYLIKKEYWWHNPGLMLTRLDELKRKVTALLSDARKPAYFVEVPSKNFEKQK